MIDYTKLIPRAYFKKSRDFQMLARLLSIAFSTSKYNSSTLRHMNNPEIVNTVFLPELLTKVGVINDYNYTDQQMIDICKCYADIIKKKGTLTGLNNLCKLYSRLSNTTITLVIDTVDNQLLHITSTGAADDDLLKSLIDSVAPVGTIYDFTHIENRDLDDNVTVSEDIDTTVREDDERFEFSNNSTEVIVTEINRSDE